MVKGVAISAFERALVAYARKFPIRRGKLRLIEHLWRTAVGTGATQRVAILKYGGMKIPCDLTGMLQRQFYFFGTYFVEEHLLDCWRMNAKRASVIFDIGANFGIYSLAALASHQEAIVHAFEPTPELASNLRETAKLNRLTTLFVHEVAVSSRHGQGDLHRVDGGGTNEGMNYIRLPTGELGDECVRMICLDDFCKEHSISGVDLLKVDVQGHEHLVLRGAKELINRGAVGTIYMELNWQPGSINGCPATESIQLLAHAGYQFANPADCENWREPGYWLHNLGDVIARKRFANKCRA
jgi:FkbM family methyltransferase